MDGNEVEEADIEQQTLQEMLGEPEKRQGERDARWNSVRKEHIRTHSFCIACGNTSNLEAHHIKPFSQNPELELDPNNLVTLCTCSVRDKMNCHLMMGHNGSMQEHNPNVVHDSIQMLKRVNRDKYDEICKRVSVASMNALKCVNEHICGNHYDAGGISLSTADRLIRSGMPFCIDDKDIADAARVGEYAAMARAGLISIESNLSHKLMASFSRDEIREIAIILLSSKSMCHSRLLSNEQVTHAWENEAMARIRDSLHFHYGTRPTRESKQPIAYELMPYQIDDNFNENYPF